MSWSPTIVSNAKWAYVSFSMASFFKKNIILLDNCKNKTAVEMSIVHQFAIPIYISINITVVVLNNTLMFNYKCQN